LNINNLRNTVQIHKQL